MVDLIVPILRALLAVCAVSVSACTTTYLPRYDPSGYSYDEPVVVVQPQFFPFWSPDGFFFDGYGGLYADPYGYGHGPVWPVWPVVRETFEPTPVTARPPERTVPFRQASLQRRTIVHRRADRPGGVIHSLPEAGPPEVRSNRLQTPASTRPVGLERPRVADATASRRATRPAHAASVAHASPVTPVMPAERRRRN